MDVRGDPASAAPSTAGACRFAVLGGAKLRTSWRPR
jgi:hypothetical protein